MWVLAILLIAGAGFLMLFTALNRKKNREEVEVNFEMDEECCGAHEVCTKDSLLNPDCEIIYYDDDELDELAGITPSSYTENQRNLLTEVFYTLRESDVAGWLRSLQLRKIELPEDIKDEALMIVRERRQVKS